MRNRIFFFSALLLLVVIGPGVGTAAELVMFESDGCAWCDAWHEEVGVVYAKTAEARVAPLRRVRIEDPAPDDLSHVRGIHYTPTFVLMEDGEEVGRILGYPGEDFFWGLPNMELGKLKPRVPAGSLAGRGGVSGAPGQKRYRAIQTSEFLATRFTARAGSHMMA